ncbi:PREDICTED: DNA excision repair protein ERCC-1 isoform X1 [Prunus mume]|uniref:DNA excision repair protein ERCC-1 isoform X1 n=1 Tax=Prunus mume TaxID=102107 RepID=A0ABM0PYI4_PRUMU|nr:PREDICTED: DNA excision repair protein ERCC-1 isoform X1 [Prunus mume]
MEDEHGGQNTESDQNKNKKKTVIKIPSFQEVLESSQSKSTPQSLFTPSQSFSQAFAFVKSSEFYSPPPPPATSSQPLQASDTGNSSKTGQSDVPSSSAPTNAVASSSSPAQRRNAIIVSHRQFYYFQLRVKSNSSMQKGNPLLKHIRNVRWEFADIVCDYLLGQSSCALYLSLRYHLLHPDYLYYRIRELQKNFKLRVVLCHIDVEDVVKPLLEVTKTALLHECTLLCGWSLEECGRYLETIKVYENKPADIIQGQMDTDYLSRLNHALTTVRHVNKTDVVTLGTTFGSLSHIMDVSMEDLARCPGIGERKVKRLYDTFHEPFKRVVASRPAVPETSAPSNAEPGSVDEEDKEAEETEDESKRRKKEPELTVKSALSVAFSKYADKVNKKNSKTQREEKGETSAAMEAETEEMRSK